MVFASAGRLVLCISEGIYTDVCFHGGVVYVASSENPYSPIYAYTINGPIDEKSSWAITRVICPPCTGQHHHTMRFNDKYTILACRDKKTVFKMRLEDFELVSTYCSSEDGAVDFEAPYICQVKPCILLF